jgi:nucleotide-binding universal stress UspA family protein
MRTVLAAIDNSAAARPVLEAAVGFADLLGATLEAVHVRENAGAIPEALASRSDVPLRVLDPPVEASLLRVLAEENVTAAVFGARGTPGGRRPAGRTALHVLERATKPVLVVPPEASGLTHAFHRLLVPLEGTEESARPVVEDLCPLLAREVELVVLHVFTTATVPPVLDHPEWDLPQWSDEFLARYCPGGARVDLRTGAVGNHITRSCSEAEADMIVMSWSQNASPGHAATIRQVLENSTVPMLLLPVDGTRKPDQVERSETFSHRP